MLTFQRRHPIASSAIYQPRRIFTEGWIMFFFFFRGCSWFAFTRQGATRLRKRTSCQRVFTKPKCGFVYVSVCLWVCVGLFSGHVMLTVRDLVALLRFFRPVWYRKSLSRILLLRIQRPTPKVPPHAPATIILACLDSRSPAAVLRTSGTRCTVWEALFRA